MNINGIASAAFQMALSPVLIKPRRGLSNITSAQKTRIVVWPDIVAQATVKEDHDHEMEITQHPVAQGAMISDHAFKHPVKVTLELGWSNSPTVSAPILNPYLQAAVETAIGAIPPILRTVNNGIQSLLLSKQQGQPSAVFDTLLEIQKARALFTLYTGKKMYPNMMIKSLALSTDEKTENSLPIKMVCQEIILVNTQTVPFPASTQKNPQVTASDVDKGSVNAVPAQDFY